jgi:hypothetical protein
MTNTATKWDIPIHQKDFRHIACIQLKMLIRAVLNNAVSKDVGFETDRNRALII